MLDEFLVDPAPPPLRRHTVPQTSRPVIDRLGIITDQRCQASTHAGPRRERADGSILRLFEIMGRSANMSNAVKQDAAETGATG
jgi:hypothetical protein